MVTLKNDADIIKLSDNKYDYGLALLRIWMCFEVILDHFMSFGVQNRYELSKFQRPFYDFGGIAVPIFMILAFSFTDVSKLAGDKWKTKKRIYRLLVPYAFWNILYYIIYSIIQLNNDSNIELVHGISDLVWQFLFGSAINASLWFQMDLIVISFLFILLYRIFDSKAADKIVVVIAFIAIVLQYKGLHSKLCIIEYPNSLFGYYFESRYFIYTVVRFFEMLPMAAVGVLICRYRLFKTYAIKQTVIKIIVLAIILKVLLGTDFFLVPYGLGYQGLNVVIIAVITIFLFHYLPLNLLPDTIKQIILTVASTTMPIYYT